MSYEPTPQSQTQNQQNNTSVKSLRRATTEETLRPVGTGDLSAKSNSKKSPLSVNIREQKDAANDTMPLMDTKEQQLLIESFQVDPQRLKIDSILKDIGSVMKQLEADNTKTAVSYKLNDNVMKLKGVVDSLLSQNKYKDILIEELKSIKTPAPQNNQAIQTLQHDYDELQQKYENLRYHYETKLAFSQDNSRESNTKNKEAFERLESQKQTIYRLETDLRELTAKNQQLGDILIEAEKEKIALGNAILALTGKEDPREIVARLRNFSFGIQPNIDSINKEKVQEIQGMAEDLRRRSNLEPTAAKLPANDNWLNESDDKRNSMENKVLSLNLIEEMFAVIENTTIAQDTKQQLENNLLHVKYTIRSSIEQGNNDAAGNDNSNQRLQSMLKDYQNLLHNQNLLIKLNEDQNAKLIDLLTRAKNKYLSKELTEEMTKRAVLEIIEELDNRRVLYIDMFNKCKNIAV